MGSGSTTRGRSATDDYHLSTNWDLYGKWEGVRDALVARRAEGRSGRGAITYLSGSGGSLPYFVASGKIGPATSAPQLPTGLFTPAFASWYPDFPRVGCVIGVCTIAFQGTNQLTADLIEGARLSSLGIVAADFPGPGLIGAVIEANHRAG